jgi:two-component system response regulator YesN
MIKLLMADDEPLVLVGLQTMLNWDNYGIEICGTARNGGQAMELIEKHRPDIVVTDIRMPIASGLELMVSCREKFGRIPLFIILTSVEEYSQVRQAMSGQAVDYLVKLELTPEMLAQSIEKAKDILHSLGRATGDESSEESRGMQSLYDRFFMGLFSNQFQDEEHFRQQRAQLGIDFSYDAYAVCCCELDSPGAKDASTEHLMSLYASTTRMAKETISQYMDCHITSVDLRHFVITFCLNQQESGDYQSLLQGVLEQTIRLIKNYFNVSLDCIVGTKADAPLSISDSYNAARKALSYPNRSRPIHFHQADRKKSHIVEQVKEYIGQNLDKQLTLKQVANVFGYSPKYISLLFAKHADLSFVEYINAEKVARAKEMLLVSNAKIYEISDRLGFDSAFYFSKVFKKHTGYSPRDFVRKNM